MTRAIKIAVIGTLILGFLFELFFISSCSEIELVKWRSIDDSFYYLNVAWNFAKGYGVTFDRINETNGVQPLWFLVISGIASCTEEKADLFRAVLYFQAFLLFLAPLFSFLLLSRRCGVVVSALFAIFLFCLSRSVLFLVGLESSLNLLFIAICGGLLVNYVEKRSRLTGIFLSIVCGILVFIRYDNAIWLIGVLLGVLYLLLREKTRLKEILYLLFSTIGTILLFLVASFTVFAGNIAPISGLARVILENNLIKLGNWGGNSLFIHYLSSIMRALCVFMGNIVPAESVFVLLLPIILLFFAHIFRKKGEKAHLNGEKAAKNKTKITVLAIIAIFIVLHFIIDKIVFSCRGSTYMWHNVAEAYFFGFVIFIIGAGFVLQKIGKLSTPIMIILLVSFLFAGGFATRASTNEMELSNNMYRLGFDPILYKGRYKIAQIVKNSTDDDIIIGSWNAGQLGFFSERRIVNLDGVINSNEYIEVLKQRKLLTYLKGNDINYILDYGIDRYWGYYSDEKLSYDVVREFCEESPPNRVLKLVRIN